MESYYRVQKLRNVIIEIISAAGLDKTQAPVFAESILTADLRGVMSHGTVRVPAYVSRVESGVMDPKCEMKFLRDEGATALLDAGNGFGQIAGHKAMSHAIEKARTNGIGFVTVRNSNHFGLASFYSMMALQENMIGIVLTNASPAMNPYGTLSPLLGTNPVSIAVPAEKEKPIVLDMSTSMVARGKIRLAALTGKQIPLGWAADSEGHPTTDAKAALKGSLEPIGGVKGSGLSLVFDILCGILTGSCLTGEVKTVVDLSGPAKTGHVFCAVNISGFICPEQFKKDVDAVINRIKGLPHKNEVFLPGEIEFNLAQKRQKEGIPLDDAVVESLNSLAARYGIGPIESD